MVADERELRRRCCPEYTGNSISTHPTITSDIATKAAVGLALCSDGCGRWLHDILR